MKIPMPTGEFAVQRAMRILIKIKDGEYLVEVVNSVDDAFARCRRHGAMGWDHIGWQESI